MIHLSEQQRQVSVHCKSDPLLLALKYSCHFLYTAISFLDEKDHPPAHSGNVGRIPSLAVQPKQALSHFLSGIAVCALQEGIPLAAEVAKQGGCE